MDPHQKTLASDDLGVAFATQALFDLFGCTGPEDGAAFCRRLNQLGRIESGSERLAKHGPRKAPDYVFTTQDEKILIVECKGSQSNLRSLKNAMKTGVLQKHSIKFHENCHERQYVAQRLVTGLFLSREGKTRRSTLVIRDPAPEDPVVVSSKIEWRDINEAVLRGKLGRLLMAAGLVDTAQTLSSIERTDGEGEQAAPEQMALVVENDWGRLTSWKDKHGSWRGQQIDVLLTIAAVFGGKPYRRVSIRYGVASSLREKLKMVKLHDTQYLMERLPNLAELLREKPSESDGPVAEIFFPDLFIARLELYPQ